LVVLSEIKSLGHAPQACLRHAVALFVDADLALKRRAIIGRSLRDPLHLPICLPISRVLCEKRGL